MMMSTAVRRQVAAAVAAATAERDGIQANLLELDDSFGKRLLSGAALTGKSRQRWTAASADLASLWEIFPAYTGIVDQAGAMLAVRHLSGAALTDINALLTEASVRLSRRQAPLDERDVTDGRRSDLTLAAAVQQMKSTFARVAEVLAAAESVWNKTAGGLGEIGAALSRTQEQALALGDGEVTRALDVAMSELSQLRDVLNCDPLALWNGRVDTGRLDLLRKRAGEVASRTADLARLRNEAQQRIAAAQASVAAITTAQRDAAAASEQAAAQVASAALPPPPADTADLDQRLAALDTLRAGGHWRRLASDLDVIDREASAARQRYLEAAEAARALVTRRDELLGLLDAYQVKAARLGAGADPELASIYQHAMDLLRSTPSDLAAAEAAVTAHKQAVLARAGRVTVIRYP